MDIIESRIVRVYPENFKKMSHEVDEIAQHISMLPKRNIQTVLSCPYLTETDTVELLGFWNNKIVGAIEYCFPLKILVDNVEYYVSSGSTLYVDEEYRKESGMGAFLMMEKTKVHPSKNNISSGVSQMALPLYKKLKYTAFENPRLMYIIHSYSVVEHFLPIGSPLVQLVSAIIDCILSLYKKAVNRINNLEQYSCQRINSVTADVLDIIEQDEHACREVHDEAWWNWIMNNSLSESNAHKELYEIRHKGRVVGFFLNKIEFHETASSRGFKNVNLGSVIEWGFNKNSTLNEYKTQMLAIMNMPKDVDAVELISTDKEVIKRFKRSIMMQVGYANMLLRLKGVPKGLWESMSNWRIRLASADVALN